MNENTGSIELFADDFTTYQPAELMDADYFQVKHQPGAHTPQQLGPWRQTSLHYAWKSPRIKKWWDCSLPWQITVHDNRQWLEQPEKFFNVVFMAGDENWNNYTLDLDLAVNDGPGGPIVRYRTSRQNYWVAFQAGQPVKLIRRDQDNHVVLGMSQGLNVENNRVYHCQVICSGSFLNVAVDGQTYISVRDQTYGQGAIALRTEGPCRFTSIRVITTPEEMTALKSRTRACSALLAGKRRRIPPPKFLLETPLPPSTTSVHLRDVNDDGQLEIVACNVVVPVSDNIRLSKITVLDWNGRELWTLGEVLPDMRQVHGAFTFNTADIDGDGRTEILVTRDFEILILDGATGQIKNKAPTPQTYYGRENVYPQAVGDSILVCNLRGLKTPQDFILKDRYCNMWAYTSDLKPIWHRFLNTGHYPRAADINGDGKDEIMAGYSMLSADGFTMWTVPGGDPNCNRYPGSEHMDACLLERFGSEPDAPLRIAMCASDLGFILMDVQGNIIARHKIGHAQGLSAARFRSDLPGRQFLAITDWGNQGILNMFDSEGNPLLIRELPGCDIINLIPVNWLGDGSALILMKALADGNFDPVADLPSGRCGASPYVYDMNNDGVDEIFFVENNILRVYGPAEKPARCIPQTRRSLTNWNVYGGFYL